MPRPDLFSPRWLRASAGSPHPAMPKYYAARMDSGDPDYVGTLQQLDDAMGDLVQALQGRKVFNDTLLFYT